MREKLTQSYYETAANIADNQHSDHKLLTNVELMEHKDRTEHWVAKMREKESILDIEEILVIKIQLTKM